MLSDETLYVRLSHGEDNLVERKPENVKRDEIRRTVVAFANSTADGQVAVLFIGVGDKGEILGVQSTDSQQRTVREVCTFDCYPKVDFEIRSLTVEGRTVLAVQIPASKSKPHFAGPAFVRQGAASVAASPALYEELLLSRNDKARRILGWRHQFITVQCIQHKLGDPRRISSAGYREVLQCRVLECDAHVVQLEIVASSRRVSEPLDMVTISKDEEKWCPMLLVRGL